MPVPILQKVMSATGRKRLTAQQEKLLNTFMTNGFDAKEAAVEAGYDRPHQALRALKDELLEIVEMHLVSHAGVAAETIKNVMVSDDPIPNVAAKLEAAKTTLDRVGLGKKEKLEVDHTVKGGLFILPSKHEEKVINAEAQE